LAALKNEYGVPTATRLARLFCQRAGELLELMHQQDPRANGEVMKKQVHELKGQASVLGFQTTVGLCLKLREQLEGNLENVKGYLRELDRELLILQNELLLVESM
jgi:HPt (histidine-containing phosphotransfer) domain-containing protein